MALTQNNNDPIMGGGMNFSSGGPAGWSGSPGYGSAFAPPQANFGSQYGGMSQPSVGNNGYGMPSSGNSGGLGGVLGTLGGLYGAYSGANNSQQLLNASQAGFGMAQNAYNPSLYGMNGVGGTGFSVSSPNGGPGSINSSLGAFNPMYGQYAQQAAQYGNLGMGLAQGAAGGAQGAYQNALGSIMPQLQQMQGNLLAQNNNALFQRGQLGSGSFGQMGAGGNPVNLTTQSLGAGFAQQDLNAIQMAQNQGLNFFNSNMQGAGAMGNLGFGSTNAGLGMIGAQNALGQLPLQYAQMTGNQRVNATNANSMAANVGNNVLNAGNTGYGGLASGLGGLLQGSNGLGGLFSSAGNAISSMFGGGGGGGTPNSGTDNSGGYIDASGNYIPAGSNTFGQGNTLGDMTGFTGNVDYSQQAGAFGGPSFNGAGGQAANAQQTGGGFGGQTMGQYGQDATSLLNMYNGLQRGGVAGTAGAALGAGTLAQNMTGQQVPGLGGASNALGIYNGLKQGGVMGYGGAAVNAGGLANQFGANIPYLGPASAALSVYNAANNWKSGATGQDALQGAEAGASIGTAIMPGIGTIAGGLIGGAAGAISSAFGGGQTDPETKNWSSFINATGGANATQAQVNQATQNMSPQSAFNLLSGVMDIKDGRIPFVNAFGRMGESTVLNGMTNQINSAITSGKVSKNATPQQLYQQVVQPWLNSKGATITSTTGGLQLQSVLQSLIGSWQKGALTSKTALTSSGSKDSSLAAYGA